MNRRNQSLQAAEAWADTADLTTDPGSGIRTHSQERRDHAKRR